MVLPVHGGVGRRAFTGALLGWSAASVHARDVLTITAVNKTGASVVAARLLTDIYRRAGLALQIEAQPAPRAGLTALSGQADGELVRIASYGQNYPQLIRIDPPFYRVGVRAYSLPSRSASVRSRDDLKHYTLGSIRGMAYVHDLTEHHPAVTQTQDALQLFRMLLAGRLDLALCTTQAARASLLSLGTPEVDASPELAAFELHHYLHERRRDLAPRIADAVRRMRDSGELAQLAAAYETAQRE
ncbi:transporter substrate-binding domain-containing protein [Roseateles asaccharophilus]|uniref:ABC-type amino acid transport substrate-binding protein n=1 Tax=Roseateles asaccharophilus TaxID=582607 RepID=A0ABU2AFC8_9BURK|nr:transporter substrate-binding domain-containing protein [Roseateles asaccharophilus]MDR7335918.1 ABC-type amino acid transport substrate-binding protein [Roseateles asaccharophilus]